MGKTSLKYTYKVGSKSKTKTLTLDLYQKD